ncbi:hypothetical protein EZS27_008010 [termite gut metagenome]|uniref:Uncharacterized protein n=1 Tax=termite gut metagenome TaxID=433724 RepID=A0A5J4SF21_9ZZZZ
MKYKTDCGHYLDHVDTVNLIRSWVNALKKQGWTYNRVLEYILNSCEEDEFEIEKFVKTFFHETD